MTRETVKICREGGRRDAKTGVYTVFDVCTGRDAPFLWHRSLADGTFAPAAAIPSFAGEDVVENVGWTWGRP